MTRPNLLIAPSGAVRAAWRILVFVAVFLGSVVVLAALFNPVLTAVAGFTGGPVFGNSLVLLLGALVATAVCTRALDRTGWSDVWMGRGAARPRALSEGLLLGALAIGVPCLVLVTVGRLGFASSPKGSWWGYAARMAVILLPAALFEEVLTRGYLLAVLRESIGWRSALVVTSLLFGLLHTLNAGATVQTISVVILAGVFLGGIVLLTGSVYAAWMAHFGWNWCMAALLHSSVSGIAFHTPNYRLIDTGPAWLTGGAWGPEGGAAAAVGLLAGLAYLNARRVRREES